MKKYTTPDMEITMFKNEDVITESVGNDNGGDEGVDEI
jgi:hypothetical protein